MGDGGCEVSWKRRSNSALEVGERRLELRSCIQRTQTQVARRLQRLQQHRDARLSELV